MLTVDLRCELPQRLLAVLALGVREGGFGCRSLLRILDRPRDVIGLHEVVPDLAHLHLGQPGHGLAVLARDHACDPPCVRLVELVVPTGDEEAGGEALHVPLPGAGQRLVEVVEVEHQASLG